MHSKLFAFLGLTLISTQLKAIEPSWVEIETPRNLTSDQLSIEAKRYTVLVESKVKGVFSGNQSQGQGTGFIFSIKDGKALILTNRHVVESSNMQAQEILVKFNTPNSDEAPFEEVNASKIFQSDRYDAAILEVDIRQLKESSSYIIAAPIPSKNLFFSAIKNNPAVLAIGNPFGRNNTITSGNISRDLSPIEEQPWMALSGPVEPLQLSAPINPGNSGGPLVSVSTGVVVGINTMQLARAQNMNYALSVYHVLQEWLAIQSKPELKYHRFLPINVQPLSKEAIKRDVSLFAALQSAARTYLTRYDSVLYVADAGQQTVLEAGDILVKVNDAVIGSDTERLSWFIDVNLASTVKLTVIRQGKVIVVDEVPWETKEDASLEDRYLIVGGLIFQDPSSQQRMAFGSPSGGVIVTGVTKKSVNQIPPNVHVTDIKIDDRFVAINNLDHLKRLIQEHRDRATVPYALIRFYPAVVISSNSGPLPLLGRRALSKLLITNNSFYSHTEKPLESLRKAISFDRFGSSSEDFDAGDQ